MTSTSLETLRRRFVARDRARPPAVWFGLDKVSEAALLDRLPRWWIDLLASV